MYQFNINTQGIVEFQESSVVYRLDIIESERGFGQKIDEKLYFLTEELARKYQNEYNYKFNNKDFVPDWYMVAQYHGPISVKDLPKNTIIMANLGRFEENDKFGCNLDNW